MATHSINSQAEETFVLASVTESYNIKRDINITGTMVFVQDEEPSNDAYGLYAFNNAENLNVYPPSQRSNYEVVNKQQVATAPNIAWSAQLEQFNIEPTSRIVDLQIPIEDLPSSYTDEDIISWGRANAGLRQASDIY
jgi:hypothetical protein